LAEHRGPQEEGEKGGCRLIHHRGGGGRGEEVYFIPSVAAGRIEAVRRGGRGTRCPISTPGEREEKGGGPHLVLEGKKKGVGCLGGGGKGEERSQITFSEGGRKRRGNPSPQSSERTVVLQEGGEGSLQPFFVGKKKGEKGRKLAIFDVSP